MANITTLSNGTITAAHSSVQDHGRMYVADVIIDFAEALVAKGSALASSDTIEAIVCPPGTYILWAGVQCIVPDNATTLTIDLGFTGGTVDHFVDGFDQAAAAAGDFGVHDIANVPIAAQLVGATGDTIDVLFATLTGTLSTGKMRVYAMLADVSYVNKAPGLAVIGS